MSILKEDLQGKLKKARIEGKAEANKEWEKKVVGLTEAFEKEYELMLAEKNAEIETLEEQLIREKVISKKAEDVYYYAWDMIKKSLSLVAKMKIKVSMIFDRSNQMYQDAISVNDEAEMLYAEMDKMDIVNREKIGLPQIKHRKK